MAQSLHHEMLSSFAVMPAFGRTIRKDNSRMFMRERGVHRVVTSMASPVRPASKKVGPPPRRIRTPFGAKTHFLHYQSNLVF